MKKGYNSRNFLLRVKQVNEIYMEHAQRGLTVETIYRKYVKDQYLIARGTFYRYLSIPYKKLLSEFE
jgi:hypothetical protein